MKKNYLLLAIFSFCAACSNDNPSRPTNQPSGPSSKLLPQLSTGTKSDFKKIEKLPAGIENIFGVMPLKENGFYEFSFPRQDINATAEGFRIDPRSVLTTWIAFTPMDSAGSSGMLMGDIVLLESECKIVLKKLDEKGIDITSIHNNLLGEKPKTMTLHITAMGDPVGLFSSLKEVLSATATPFKINNSDTASNVNWEKTEDLLGYRGNKEGMILKFTIPRKEKIKDGGVELPENFGVNTIINFQRMGPNTAVSGEFVLLPSEVNTVYKMLSRGNILVTALHNHMLFEQPRLFFLHFWALDDPEKLASVLHDVLVSTNHIDGDK